MPGGQMGRIAHLENYPGAMGEVSGRKLAEIMKNQAVTFGAEFMPGLAVEMKKGIGSYFIKTSLGQEVEGRVVIIATGASPRKLGIPGEAEFEGKGVSFCATCDGAFYKGLDVMVVGGGNSALSEALHLSHIAKSVVISYRKAEFTLPEKVLIDRVIATPNIRIEFNSELAEILGGEFVEKVQFKDGGEVKVDGVFLAIGHVPNTEFLPEGWIKDGAGHIVTELNRMQIRGEGVFVCGDVRSESVKQVVIAAGQGAQAAMEANDWL